jgi:hypothetical protein
MSAVAEAQTVTRIALSRGSSMLVRRDADAGVQASLGPITRQVTAAVRRLRTSPDSETLSPQLKIIE